MKVIDLIVNESYWDLFKKGPFKKQSFLPLELHDLTPRKFSALEFTRNLAILMKQRDRNTSAIYGIEIKSNGSSRSGRIPLVRYTKYTQSIWKIVHELRGVEGAIAELNKLIYYLTRSKVNQKIPVPNKVLFASFSEAEYTSNGKFSDYVKKQVQENNIIWISTDFIRSLFEANERVDLDSIVSKNKSIYTKESLI